MSAEIVNGARARDLDADVVVIGAGAAGLAAARLLAGRSLRTVVLEARDRVAGRAWSSPAVPGPAAAEYGAEFIHGPAAETIRLLREAGSAAVDSCGEGWAWDERGGLSRSALSSAATGSGACLCGHAFSF